MADFAKKIASEAARGCHTALDVILYVPDGCRTVPKFGRPPGSYQNIL